jgi:hypothetical protein
MNRDSYRIIRAGCLPGCGLRNRQTEHASQNRSKHGFGSSETVSLMDPPGEYAFSLRAGAGAAPQVKGRDQA